MSGRIRRVFLASLSLALGLASFPARAQTIVGTGLNLNPRNVSQLGSAAAQPNTIKVVKDAQTGSDCTVGGGAVWTICRSDGVSWVVFGQPGPPGPGGGVNVVAVLPTVCSQTGLLYQYTLAAHPLNRRIYRCNDVTNGPTPINPDIDLKGDCGVKGDVATDDGPAWNACAAEYAIGFRLHCVGQMNMRIASVSANFGSWKFNQLTGDEGNGGGTLDGAHGCQFLYDGADGGIGFDAQQMYHSKILNVDFNCAPYWPNFGYVGATKHARVCLWFERVNGGGSNSSESTLENVSVVDYETVTWAVASYTITSSDGNPANASIAVVTSVAHNLSPTRAAIDAGGDSACITLTGTARLCGQVSASADTTHFVMVNLILAGAGALPANCAAACGTAYPRQRLIQVGDISGQNSEFFTLHHIQVLGWGYDGLEPNTNTPYADKLAGIGLWIALNNAFNTHVVDSGFNNLDAAFHNTTNAVFQNNHGETVAAVYENPGAMDASNDDYECVAGIIRAGQAGKAHKIHGDSMRYDMCLDTTFPGPLFELGANSRLTLDGFNDGASSSNFVLPNGVFRHANGVGYSTAYVLVHGDLKLNNFAYDPAEASNYNNGTITISKADGLWNPQAMPLPFGVNAWTLENNPAATGARFGFLTPGSRGLNGGPARVFPQVSFGSNMFGGNARTSSACPDLDGCFGDGGLDQGGTRAPQEAPTATYAGAAGAVNWGFALAALDANGNATPMGPSIVWATTAGPAATDGTHVFTIGLTHPPPGATNYVLYRINPADSSQACTIRASVTVPYTLNAAAPCLDNGAAYANITSTYNTTKSAAEYLSVKSRLKLVDQGACTMVAGTCAAQTLAAIYTAAPACFATWTGTGTLTGILQSASTTTAVTPASSVNTDTAVVNWVCFGN